MVGVMRKFMALALLCAILTDCTAQEIETAADVCDIASKALGCVSDAIYEANK